MWSRARGWGPRGAGRRGRRHALTSLFGAWRQAGNETACRQALEAGADANYARGDRGGQGALHAACARGQAHIVRLLVSKGAVVNMPDFWGRRPLLHAIPSSGRGGASAAVPGRLDAGQHTRPQPPDKGVPGVPGLGAHVDVVKVLLGAGARAGCRDPVSENTALHVAAHDNQLEIVRALLRAGAGAGCRNLGGQRALEVALQEVPPPLECLPELRPLAGTLAP